MPGNRLALAVFICSQQQQIHFLEFLLQVSDTLLGITTHHIERLKLLVDLYAQAGPFLALVLGGDLIRPMGQVPHMTHRGLHRVLVRQPLEEVPQGLCLCG